MAQAGAQQVGFCFSNKPGYPNQRALWRIGVVVDDESNRDSRIASGILTEFDHKAANHLR